MKQAAMILAAGLSSRMGDFKPLLPFEGKPAIVYLLDKFQEAGIKDYIIVVGHKAGEIQEVLADYPHVHLVKNEAYARTEMMDSAKLGIKEAESLGFDAILFSPVDLPLVDVETIRQVAKTHAEIVFPINEGKQGHPVRIAASVFASLLDYKGPSGMKGALAQEPDKVKFIEVANPYIYKDMDTKDDYEHMQKETQRDDPEEYNG